MIIKLSLVVLLQILSLFAVLTDVLAGELSLNSNGMIVWRASNVGPETEYNNDGSVARLFVRKTQPVIGTGAAAIHEAQAVAEENGKAAIIRFFKEEVTTRSMISEFEADIERSEAQLKVGSMIGQISKDTKQRLVRGTSNFISSFASGQLRGVVILDEGYDTQKGLVWVDIGISHASIGAAKSFQEEMR